MEENNEQLSVADFKKWLEGAEAFQEADWCPNQTQWKAIRDKISLLVVTAPLPTQYRQPVVNNMVNQQQPMQMPQMNQAPPSGEDIRLQPTPVDPQRPRANSVLSNNGTVGPGLGSIGSMQVTAGVTKVVDRNAPK